MLTNSSSEGLKSLKDLRDTNSKNISESENSKQSEKGEEKFRGWIHPKEHIKSIVVTRKADPRLKTRPKYRDDYGAGRCRSYADDKRGSFRGRGGGSRRNDRYEEDGYVSRQRFQEPLSKLKSSDGITVSSGKYYSGNDGHNNKGGEGFDHNLNGHAFHGGLLA
ncbi:hypothetical protein AAG570_013602 [Ranatra chinensis]|uniref:Uncharacterized protein n=1 Tax=Ranatra chinensis TaxID=642074 RepID=A0ABD0YCP6_9HEMI